MTNTYSEKFRFRQAHFRTCKLIIDVIEDIKSGYNDLEIKIGDLIIDGSIMKLTEYASKLLDNSEVVDIVASGEYPEEKLKRWCRYIAKAYNDYLEDRLIR